MGALSYCELKKLHDDAQYNEDFRLTTPDYVAMCRKKDIIEDKALEHAKKNITEASELQDAMDLYENTTLPNYTEQKEKAAECVQQLDASSANFTRESMAKVLQAEGKNAYNESLSMTKSFKKGEIDPNEYMNKFIASRKRYYEMKEYTEIILHSELEQ